MELGQSCLNLPAAVLPKGAAQQKKGSGDGGREGGGGDKRGFKDGS